MDPYQNPDAASAETLEAMTTRLEDRGTNPRFMGMIDEYLETAKKLSSHSFKRILDLGCGSGVVTRQLAREFGDEAEIHGADISAAFLEEAKKRSSDFPEITWQKIGADSLPYEKGSFDLVILHTLMSHVPDPVDTLKLAAEVLKKGGVLVVFDADYASTTYGYPDFEKMREIDHELLAAVAANLDVCRQMPRYLKEAGLKLSEHQSYLLSEAGQGDFWLSSVKGFAKLIPALNILPTEEGKDWVKHMLDSHDNGTFFAASSFYSFLATAR